MPDLLQQLKTALAPLEIHLAPAREGDPLATLMPFKENHPKYALDEAGNIIGLNLGRTGLTDAQWQAMMNLPGLARGLRALNLCENELTDIRFPAEMGALQFLNLSENKGLRTVDLSALPPTSPLEKLDLSECALESFTLPPLVALQTCDLSRNQLTALQVLGNSPKLFYLDAGNNQLTDFVLEGAFEGLKYLYLNDNKLQTITFRRNLTLLQLLHLRHNQLETLPNLLGFTSLQTLNLYGNPLKTMRDVISGEEDGNSWGAVRSYFLSQQKSDLQYLHQAKMVLVGNGEVGKTSIRLKLLNKDARLPAKNERTPGLDIQPYQVEDLEPGITTLSEAIDFQLNIWDFGGQGKYREVQQLFCSRKTLYLFVTAHDDKRDLKEDYVGFNYWLSMVNAYSFDDAENRHSPVIHVVNKIDEKDQPVNQEDYQSTFPNIARFVKISCETLKNFDDLEAAIRETLPEVSADIFTARFTEFWLAVKAELERRKAENHITKKEYLDICARHNLDEEEANHWIKILDRIGTVIYFGDNTELRDWVILNPIWAKDALYNVLNSQLAEGGILRPNVFPDIWKPPYTAEEREHLIQMMLAYKLCYRQTGPRGEPEYVVPALFYDTPPTIPAYLQTPDYQLKFVFTPFLPAGTVNKLMVMLHEAKAIAVTEQGEDHSGEKRPFTLPIEVDADFMWKNNVIARDAANNTHAHVREDWEAQTVFLDLFGQNCAPLFEYILQMLRNINHALVSTKSMTQLHMEVWARRADVWAPWSTLESLGVPFFPPADDPEQHRSVFMFSGKTSPRPVPTAPLRDPDVLPAGAQTGMIGTENGKKAKILFLEATPPQYSRLQTGREHRSLKAQLERGRARDRFEFLPPVFDVTLSELVRAMNDEPDIVHFAGHGLEQGIIISNENGTTNMIPDNALVRLFRPLEGKTQLVILNACYSAAQAALISQFGMYVVGNNVPISDPAAISFSEGLYNGLGEGKTFAAALNDAMIFLETTNAAAVAGIEVWKNGQILAI